MLTQADLGARKVPETTPAPVGLSSNPNFVATNVQGPSPIRKGTDFDASFVRRSASVDMNLNPALPIRPPGGPVKRVMFSAGAAETPFQNQQQTLQRPLISTPGAVLLVKRSTRLSGNATPQWKKLESHPSRHPRLRLSKISMTAYFASSDRCQKASSRQTC